MSHVIIVFPPGAGGNHLKNLVNKRLSVEKLLDLYTRESTVHARPGNNFNSIELLEEKLTHGHFGEVMSYQSLVKSLEDKKFVIISPDTPEDRQLLFRRREQLGSAYSCYSLNGYFDGEQVFLYEPFMYHYYFNTAMENIMNISVHEFYKEDITDVLERLSYFLQIDLDFNLCNKLHDIWRNNNNIDSL
jgi:hypothetical protein